MKKIIIAVAVALGASACGGGNPVTQYLVNVDNQETITAAPNATCADAQQGQTVITTDLKTDVTLNIYLESDGATTTAELGGLVFTGKKAGDIYTLTDSKSDVNSDVQNLTEVDSDLYTLTVTQNGNFVTGTLVHDHHSNCSGSLCNSPTIDCIYTTSLRGEKLPDNGSLAALNPVGNQGNSNP